MKRFLPVIVLLSVSIVIAAWQASEVLARIQQLLWFEEKFSGDEDGVTSITSGTSATVFFIMGTIVGCATCLTGIGRVSDLKSRYWKPAFFLPMCSIMVFGIGWIVLIISPYVDLYAR